MAECFGVEIRQIAARWNTLAGWQRGIIGTGVVLGALTLFLAIAFSVAMSLSH